MGSMGSSAVATLVNYFNAVSVTVMVLCAVFGVITIVKRRGLRSNTSGGKGAKKKGGQGARALSSAFCVAALAAFALEVTFFNIQHYMKLFAGPELQTLDASPENPNIILTTGGMPAELLIEKDEETNASRAVVIFKDLNRNVTSIFVEMGYGETEAIEMTVEWTDGISNANRFTKKLNKYIPRDDYAPIQPRGKVQELKVMLTGSRSDNIIEIKSIMLNKQIPYYFSGLRLIAVSFLFFAILCLLIKEPRAKAAYWLFEYKFNPVNRKQSLIYALSVVALIIFSFICVSTSYTKAYQEYPVHQVYNKFLVDAIMEGRTWLNYGTPERLLNAERPYDNNYRMTNGYKFDSDVMWDWSWYKGKFYCYYGVVPAVILYLPYKLITGEYLSNNGGIFVFATAVIILMAMLWRFCVKKYMPNMGFAFYMLSFLTLFFASGIFAQLRFTRVYSIVQTAGVMFALAGCLLLLKSVENEKINRLKLFFACLCFALIAGCRPNVIFVSLLVPIILWKHRSWKLLPVVAVPYVIVAIPLCLYNYVRFGSIFEFGNQLVLSFYNFGKGTEFVVPFGWIIKILKAFYYILAPGKYTLYFPFVEGYPLQDEYVMGMLYQQLPGLGMVNFPIVICLLCLFKNVMNRKTDGTTTLMCGFIVGAAIIAIVDSIMIGFQGRYLFDFAAFIILPSLFCAHYWCVGRDGTLQNRNRQSVVHILLAASILVGSLLCVTGAFSVGVGGQIYYNPVLYRYLECSLGVIANV